MGITPLLVKPTLDADGKPVMDGRCTQAGVTAAVSVRPAADDAANFDQWYRDTAGVNIAVAGRAAARAAGRRLVRLRFRATAASTRSTTRAGSAADAREDVALADADDQRRARSHNFGFTTEIHYFFQYRGGETLTFSGDDDVWIFVNRRLALDLGGLHRRTERTLSVDQSAAALGLTVGGLYEIALFHAERHSDAVELQADADRVRADVQHMPSACGDGSLAADEQCDDGNDVRRRRLLAATAGTRSSSGTGATFPECQ